ncbi:MAG TPA: hypothetical protein VFL04_04360, partial [Rectinemataceae bacterium]|nr:hypothetical protein [Rectinemataceae bacterium]
MEGGLKALVEASFGTIWVYEDYFLISTIPGHVIGRQDFGELMMMKLEHYAERPVCAIHDNRHNSMSSFGELTLIDRLCAEYRVIGLVVVVGHPRRVREYMSRRLVMRNTDYRLAVSVEEAFAIAEQIMKASRAGPERAQSGGPPQPRG